MQKRIVVIGVSGGPCGGKTSLLQVEHERYSNLPNFGAITVPEAATLLIANAGLDMGGMASKDRGRYLETQGVILDTQLALRKIYLRLAEMSPEENMIVFEDRPVTDGNGYMTDQEFDQLLKSRGLTREEVYSWYAGIVFLRTAAKGAEAFYTTANNAARTEGLGLARMLDTLTERAYVGFPRQIAIIGNETDFEGKIRRAQEAVSHIAGLPVPTEVQRKFLLDEQALGLACPELEHARTVDIEQMYLDAPTGHEVRIRRRSDGTGSSFYQSWKENTAGLGVRLRREIAIDHDSYARLAQTAVSVLRKQRTAFIFGDQYYWIDRVNYPKKLAVLEVELTKENQVVHLPDWLGPAKEVTADPAYRMAAVAAQGVGGPHLG